ncbi:MAG TPA: trypsin-like peptidase domain-containing protein [Kiritimatiellia bacterium]|nr:trypsin-like peptidase domain-containing protein [Kiritimatiellia bacterium]
MKHLILQLLVTVGLVAQAHALPDRRSPIVQAVETAMPSVVNIGTERMVRRVHSDPRLRFRGDLFDMFLRDFLGSPPTPGYQIKHSLGSGVIVHPDGYILTNFHVIERASRIRVMLSDETVYEGTVLAGDEINDLALIKIDSANPLPAIPFAANDDLYLGETVIVLGNPFGLAHTVTVGVLSAKNREARHNGQILYRDILQTDAAVNPGNSGGPLLNIHGEMIGLNVAIYQDAQNIGFAVPVRRARDLLNRWLTPNIINKQWLGLEFSDASHGVFVSALDPDVAPSRLQPADRILAVNGEQVSDLFALNRELIRIPPEAPITLTVQREDDLFEVPSRFHPLPKPSGDLLSRTRLGLVFSCPTEEGPMPLDRFKRCMVIKEILPGGPAELAGLKPSMLVTTINDREVTSLDEVGIALEHVKPGDLVNLQLVSILEREAFLIAQTTSLQIRAN